MFGLGKLWSAMTRLAGSADSLADTLDQINQGVRQRLHLDDAPEQLDHQADDAVVDEPANGRKRRATTAAK